MQKDEEFRQWKKEIDQKCAEYLELNPEPAPPKSVEEEAKNPEHKYLLLIMPKDPCVFCGGRLFHRQECPDSLSNGIDW